MTIETASNNSNAFVFVTKVKKYIKGFLLNYYSFTRKEMGGDLAHVALAVQGAPAGSAQSLALAVAAKGMYILKC